MAIGTHADEDLEVRWRGLHWWGILTWFLFWEVIYQLSKLAAARQCSQWTKIAKLGGSYMTAFLNACMCSFLGCWILLAYLLGTDGLGRAIALDDGPAVNAVYTATRSFIGWLLMDCCHLLTHYPALGGVDMLVHHSLFLLMGALGYGYRVVPFVCGWLLLGEVSSIPLNIRWFLIQSGRGHSQMLAYTNYAFAACFFVFRVLLLNGGLVDLFVELRPLLLAPPCNAQGWAVNTVCGLLVGSSALNLYWMAKIVQMATKPREAAGRASDQAALVVRGKAHHSPGEARPMIPGEISPTLSAHSSGSDEIEEQGFVGATPATSDTCGIPQTQTAAKGMWRV